MGSKNAFNPLIRARKGFIHIVEVIIIALVMFLVVWQFTYIPGAKTEWSRTKLALQGNDVLFSLDEKDIDWFNPEEVKTEFNRAFNKSNILYDLKLRNVIKPQIMVACICNVTELATANEILKPFRINGKQVNFTLKEIDPSDISEIYDIVLLWDYNLTGYEQVSGYLEADKGIVEVRDLNADEINNWEIQKSLFGLEYNSSLSPGLQPIAFTELAGYANSTYYNIFKYFYHTPDSTWELIEEPCFFPDFLEDDERVSPKNGDERRIILRQEGTDSPALIVNQGMVEGFGRAAWLSKGPMSEEMKVLIRDLVVWAAGDTYRVVSNEITNPVTFSLYKLFRPSGLVAQWDFDEGSGTTARDTSGNANHGAIKGAEWAEGKVGKALEFNGMNDYVDVDDSVSLHRIDTAFTIEGWFKAENLSREYNPIISKHVLNDPYGNRIYVTSDGKLASKWFFTDDSDCEANSTAGAINENLWYHFAYVYNGSHIMLYVDGNPLITTYCGEGKVLKAAEGNVRMGGVG